MFPPALRSDPAHSDSATSAASLPSPAKLGPPDAICLTLFASFLLTLSFLQSRHKMFWGDEIMGSYVLHEANWHRFLEFWRAGLDSSGFWFYVFAKPWEWLAGSSETSLRMFSAVGVVASAVLIWLAARRFYSLPVVATAVSFPFLNLSVLRWQLSNARSYGLLMASTALVIYLIVHGSDDLHRELRRRFLIGSFFAYDFLAGSHILGFVFAGTLLAAQIAIDLRVRQLRWKLYASAAAGILAVTLFSLQNIHSTTAIGKPVFWTLRPSRQALFFHDVTTLGSVETATVVLFLLALFHLRRKSIRDTVYVLLLSLYLLHSAFVAISRVSTSIYVDRYLLPFALGLVLLLGELLAQLRESEEGRPWRFVLVLTGIWLFALHGAPRPNQLVLPLPNYTDDELNNLPKNLPVIDIDVGNFVEMEFYHHGHFGRPFLFPVDTEVTNALKDPGGISGYHEMDNFYRFGIDAPDVQPTGVVLARYPEFLVISAGSPTFWFAKRIQGTGAYDITDLGIYQNRVVYLHLWRVRHR